MLELKVNYISLQNISVLLGAAQTINADEDGDGSCMDIKALGLLIRNALILMR